MRIAVVTTSYPSYEGDPAGHFVEAEVAPLVAAGHEVRVLHPRPGGAFGWPGAPTRIRERPSRLLDAGVWSVHASAELVRLRPDRIVAHWALPSAFPVASAALRLLAAVGRPRTELEVVSHGSDVRVLATMPPALRRRVVAPLLRHASAWRFVSEGLRDTLGSALEHDQADTLREIAAVVPGALEVPDVGPEAEAKRRALGDRRLYVCAGRLVPSKRVDKVIDYVATSANHGSQRVDRTLVVLGDGPERPHLERLARAWQFDVRFLGTTTRREALSWIGAADELVHASRIEGLSTVIREAERLGTPVTRLE
jgi:glycosyltransferase involved in cell wall biosynthesis